MRAVQSDVVVNVYSVCVKDGQARSDCTRAALDRVLSIFAVRRLIILRLGYYRRAGELFVCVSRASARLEGNGARLIGY